MNKLTIVLIIGQYTEEIKSHFDSINLQIYDANKFYENASNNIFNESKFFGTVAYDLMNGIKVAINKADKFINKKGNNILINTLLYRLPEIKFDDLELIAICQDENKEKYMEWFNNNCKLINIDDVKNLLLSDNKISTNYKVTSGLIAEFMHFDNNLITGHITLGYNKTRDEADIIKLNNKNLINQEFESKLFSILVDDEFGGEIVLIPKLGPTIHITVNTIIKSSLSGPIMDKYNNNILEFNLTEIDASIKQDKKIRIQYISNVIIKIKDLYCYCI